MRLVDYSMNKAIGLFLLLGFKLLHFARNTRHFFEGVHLHFLYLLLIDLFFLCYDNILFANYQCYNVLNDKTFVYWGNGI